MYDAITATMPAMILAETALSFLGLGLQPPITSWGVLLQEVQDIQSIAIYPWVFLPVVFIVAASTDWLDGYFARKYNMVERGGEQAAEAAGGASGA